MNFPTTLHKNTKYKCNLTKKQAHDSDIFTIIHLFFAGNEFPDYTSIERNLSQQSHIASPCFRTSIRQQHYQLINIYI
jgi:hypothetical protein